MTRTWRVVECNVRDLHPDDRVLIHGHYGAVKTLRVRATSPAGAEHHVQYAELDDGDGDWVRYPNDTTLTVRGSDPLVRRFTFAVVVAVVVSALTLLMAGVALHGTRPGIPGQDGRNGEPGQTGRVGPQGPAGITRIITEPPRETTTTTILDEVPFP